MINSFSRRDFLGAALCGAVSACGGGTLDPNGPVPDAQVDAALAQIDNLAADLITHTGVPGMAIAVVRQTPNGIQTAYANGFGKRRVDGAAAVDADTVFQLASVSKSVGATVVAQQVGLGWIGWETPVQRELPWFSLSDPARSAELTIGDLYAHRSGLPGQAGDLLEDVGFDQIYVLQHLKLLKLDPAPFRTKYAYSNFGLTTAALAVTAALAPTAPADLEEQWAALSERVLYQPLGMRQTSSRFADFDGRSNRAYGHVPISPGSTSWKVCEVRRPDPQSPAGGVSSSVNDMARWLAMLIGKGSFHAQQLVAGAALASALTPQIQKPAPPGLPASYYGYGFGVSSTASGRTSYSHSGAFILGASTSFMVIPSLGIGIVVLTNGFPQGVPETLIAQFYDLVEYGKFQRDWWGLISPSFVALVGPGGSLAGVPLPVSPQPPRDLSTYVGQYRNDFYQTLLVTQDNGALVLEVGPKAHPMRLTHWDGDLFAWTPDGDGGDPRSLFKVNFAANNAQVTLEYFDDDGMGTFARIV